MLSIAESTVTSKNQTTLPKSVVEALGVKPADKLVYEIQDGTVTITAKTGRLADLAGLLRGRGKRHGRKPPTVEEMDAAIRRRAGAAYSRGLEGKTQSRKSRASRSA